MKRVLLLAALLLFLLSGCKNTSAQVEIVATTAPVYEFAKTICEGTDVQIAQLITEKISCVHDYTLQSQQMHLLESADLVLISGFGLEDFLKDALKSAMNIEDTSTGITPLCQKEHDHGDHGHNHDTDPHIWLSPENAAIMAENIYNTLISKYPQFKNTFDKNYQILSGKFLQLSNYATDTLATLSCRNLITFHDGFSYMAKAFNLQILRAIEEESGSEASASELISVCDLVNNNEIPAIFTEKNGSNASAQIIANETGVKVYTLDMGISEGNYFEIMYQNIETLKEALE